MEDIIQKYKKQKRVKNLSIVISSLCLALALNIYISANNIWFDMIKSSVIESSSKNKKADLYMEKTENKAENIVWIKAFQEMKDVKSVSFSIAYNYDNVEIKNKFTNIKDAEVLNLSNTSWFNTVLINFKNPTTIKSWEKILDIVLSKKENVAESLNLVTSNFVDKNENAYMLSTSGIDF